MLNITRRINAKANLSALKVSFGIPANNSDAASARRLSETVNQICPGVFQVGESTCDLWRESCTCKRARSQKAKATARPCPHYLALYLAGEWTPIYNPTTYLESIGLQQPEILETHCHATLPTCYPPAPLGFRILEACNGWTTLENLATGTHASVESSKIRNMRPIYEVS